MYWLFLVVSFIFGSIVGSFLNVVVLRLNTGEKIVRTRSRCFSCGKILKWYELIPLISFIIQTRRCRGCGSKISWQYPVVEFLMGIISIFVFVRLFAFSMPITQILEVWVWLFNTLLFASLFALAVYDYRTKIIDSTLLSWFTVFAFAGTIMRWYEVGVVLFADVISAFLIASFFYVMWFVSKGKWMGKGDSFVALPLSLFIGFPMNIAAFIFSFWIGGIVGVLLLLTRFISPSAGGSLKSEIPFAPFLAMGAFLAWLHGETIIHYFMIY
jgi:leader peptidase (prepilin peptidase) / N-methyltransferase